MNPSIKLFLKNVALFLIPLYILLGVYIICDPFKVIFPYESFYKSGEPPYVTSNRCYTSTATFDRYRKSNKYDSYIFGNSRSIFYEVDDWKKHIGEDASCFHFDGSSETLYAIDQKIKYINNKHQPFKNALFVLDYETLSTTIPLESHLFAVAPQLTGYRNWFTFHAAFIKAFLSPRFLCSYIDFRINREVKEYMKKGNLLDDRPIYYDLSTNEEKYLHFEKLIAEDKYYTETKKAVFYNRDTTEHYSPPAIGDKQLEILSGIQEILKKNNTNYKLVISPLYNQKKLNPADLKILREIFGENNVSDFSGINELTGDYRNYYEASHYRPHVARKVMECSYALKPVNSDR